MHFEKFDENIYAKETFAQNEKFKHTYRVFKTIAHM